MTELLNTAHPEWWASDGTSPPPEWNATAGTIHFLLATNFAYIGPTPVTGDTVTLNITSVNGGYSSGGFPAPYYTINGVVTYLTPSASQTVTVTLAAGDAFAFVANAAPTYQTDLTLTATYAAPVTVPDCDEIGVTSRADASAHYRTRIHDTRLLLGEKRCLVANFNGAVSKSRTIAQARWRTDYGFVAVMANARIQSDKRSSAVDLIANWLGDSIVRCEATLDNGETYIQTFRIDVSGSPIFMPVSQGSGPVELVAEATA